MSLKSRLTLIAVAVTLIVATMLTFIGLSIRWKQDERIADAVFAGNRLIWDQLITDHLEQLAGQVDDVNGEFDLRRALKAQDQAEIVKYAERFVSLTAKLGHYDILQLFDRSGELVYSSSNEMQIPLSPNLFRHATDQQQIQQGLTGLPNGKPVGLVIFPIQSRHKLIGLGLLAKGLEAVVERLAQRSNLGVGITDIQGRIIKQMNLPPNQFSVNEISQPNKKSVRNHRIRKHGLSVQIH